MMNDRQSMTYQQIRNRFRHVLFYIATIIVVLSPLLLIEGIVRWILPPPSIDLEDPYISFTGIRSLFVLDETGTRWKTNEARLVFFYPQSFPVKKGKNTFRIFALGGSTVQGRPYAVETSFTKWLQLNLQAAQPEKKWEVINCGGISYASYRLVPLMKELLRYEPDLFLLYTGHNEFLEDRTYRQIKRMPYLLVRLHQALLNLRSYAYAYQYFQSRNNETIEDDQVQKTVLPTEVQAMLDQYEGWKSYRRDEEWRQATIEHFRYNLATMMQIAHSASVPLILLNPVSNLKDCPPFKSEFNLDMPESHREYVLELWEKADKLKWSEVQRKLVLFREAATFKHRYADLYYLLGKCYEIMGRFSQAKKWFIQAKEEDVCPLRILEPMHEIILDTARHFGVPLVDVRALIEERTEDGISGEEWLVDHVHPSIAGHQLIADCIYDGMEEMNIIETTDNWRLERERLWESHLFSLNEAYFEHGAQTLERVSHWARGRIQIPEKESESP